MTSRQLLLAQTVHNWLLAAAIAQSRWFESVSAYLESSRSNLCSFVQVWNLASGQVLKDFKGHKAAVRCVAFSPDGTKLASGAGAEYSFETQDNSVMVNINCAFRFIRWCNHTLRHFLNLKVWDLASGQITKTLEGHKAAVNCVTFSPNGSQLASGSVDGTIKVI